MGLGGSMLGVNRVIPPFNRQTKINEGMLRKQNKSIMENSTQKS